MVEVYRAGTHGEAASQNEVSKRSGGGKMMRRGVMKAEERDTFPVESGLFESSPLRQGDLSLEHRKATPLTSSGRKGSSVK